MELRSPWLLGAAQALSSAPGGPVEMTHAEGTLPPGLVRGRPPLHPAVPGTYLVTIP